MLTITQNENHKLFIEKVNSEWWIELIDKATGNVKILTTTTKDKALSFFHGLTIEQIVRFYDKANVKWEPMYKAGLK